MSGTSITMKQQSLMDPKRRTMKGKPKALPFPIKLMIILAAQENNHAIRWMPDGRSFVVLDPKVLSKLILPNYGMASFYRSFQRKLHIWGFQEVDRVFSHKKFLRGRVDLAEKIVRAKDKNGNKNGNGAGKVVEQRGSGRDEPNEDDDDAPSQQVISESSKKKKKKKDDKGQSLHAPMPELSMSSVPLPPGAMMMGEQCPLPFPPPQNFDPAAARSRAAAWNMIQAERAMAQQQLQQLQQIIPKQQPRPFQQQQQQQQMMMMNHPQQQQQLQMMMNPQQQQLQMMMNPQQQQQQQLQMLNHHQTRQQQQQQQMMEMSSMSSMAQTSFDLVEKRERAFLQMMQQRERTFLELWEEREKTFLQVMETDNAMRRSCSTSCNPMVMEGMMMQKQRLAEQQQQFQQQQQQLQQQHYMNYMSRATSATTTLPQQQQQFPPVPLNNMQCPTHLLSAQAFVQEKIYRGETALKPPIDETDLEKRVQNNLQSIEKKKKERKKKRSSTN